MLTATTKEAQNTESVQNIFAAFGRGDVPYMLDLCTDDIKWYSHLNSIVPWAGDFSTKARVPGFFKSIYDNVEVLGFEPTEFIAQDNTVVTMGTFACRANSTGKSTDIKWIMVFKFRDGLVYSYEQFDSPSIAEIF